MVKESHKVIYGVGNQLVQEAKRQILEGTADDKNSKSMLGLLSMCFPLGSSFF